MMAENTHEVITEGIQLYFIQLPTFERLKGTIKGREKLERWLNFINYKDKEEVKMAIKISRKIEKAEKILQEAFADPLRI